MKYNDLKKKWHEIKDRPKKGSGLAPEESPLCYSLLDKLLADTNTNLEDAVCSDPTDTSHVQENYHDKIAGGAATFLMTRRNTLMRKPTHQCLTNQCVNQHQGKNLW